MFRDTSKYKMFTSHLALKYLLLFLNNKKLPIICILKISIKNRFFSIVVVGIHGKYINKGIYKIWRKISVDFDWSKIKIHS